MSPWSNELLQRITQSDDLHIAPLRDDLATSGHRLGSGRWSSTAICTCVRNSRWYRSAMKNKGGLIEAAGETIRVTFEPSDGDGINDGIDAVYQAKYSASQYLSPMVGARARAATVRITPRVEGGSS
ncbi:DUF2255 family protein (plasmid) [Ensifer sp. D2-11]